MPIEQDPIKIEIPVEEEEVVHVPETRESDLAERLDDAGRRVVSRARDAWESDERQRAQESLQTGLRQGARISRYGLVRGLNWLSARLQGVAERFTPIE